MRYVVSAIAAVYGILSVIAAIAGVKQGKKGDASVMMILGGCSMISAAGVCILGGGFDWINALCGGVLISAASFINGKRGEFHAGHHVVRACIEIALVIGFILL